MISYTVKGGSLTGTISVKGSPLAAVGMIALAMLSTDKVTLTNVPHLQDIDSLLQELRYFNIAIDWTHPHEITIHAHQPLNPQPSIALDRLAVWPPSLIAALLVRLTHLVIDLPPHVGTEELRRLLPILQLFGAQLQAQGNQLVISLQHLHGAAFALPEPEADLAVAALILAATADGPSIIDQAVINPEVEDIIACLKNMGGQLDRLDESRLSLEGQPSLKGVTHDLIPDRYEAAFLAVATLVSKGDVHITGIKPTLLTSFLAKIEQLGANYHVDKQGIRFWRGKKQLFKAFSSTAKPFPGLGNDWLLLLVPLAALADGESHFHFTQADQANQALESAKSFAIEGYTTLSQLHLFGPIPPTASNLDCLTYDRAIVALLCALSAAGTSTLERVDALDGRFESVADRLSKLGAKIKRVEQ